MKGIRKINQVVIIGKRWFERTNGNTYHSVSIDINGERLDYAPFTYGYGSQFEQTAALMLQKHGYYAKKLDWGGIWDAFQKDKRNHRDKFTVICLDVNRKKDL